MPIGRPINYIFASEDSRTDSTRPPPAEGFLKDIVSSILHEEKAILAPSGDQIGFVTFRISKVNREDSRPFHVE